MVATIPIGQANCMRVLVVLALFQLPGSACFAAPASLNAQLQSAIEIVAAQYKVPGVSVSIGIASEGTPRNFVTGRATIAPDSPAINDATLFQVGSVTKPLTAILILMLEARGLFDIDDPAGHYVSGFPSWRTATIRQLLNMTAGLKSYSDEDVVRFWCILKQRPGRRWTSRELLRLGASFAPETNFPPGAGWNYSNTNYVLAGMIARVVSDLPLPLLYRRLIFNRRPAQMPDTYYFPSAYPHAVLDRIAHGYVRQNLEIEGCGVIFPLDADVTLVNGSWAKAAGAVVSTSNDLVRGFNALFRGELLPRAQFDEFTARVSAEDGQPVSGSRVHNAYGLGMDYDYTEVTGPFWFKNGETLGYNAFVIHFPCLAMTYALTKSSATDPDQTDDMGALQAAILNTLLTSDEFAAAYHDYIAAHALPAYCAEFDIHLPATPPSPLDTPGPGGDF